MMIVNGDRSDLWGPKFAVQELYNKEKKMTVEYWWYSHIAHTDSVFVLAVLIVLRW